MRRESPKTLDFDLGFHKHRQIDVQTNELKIYELFSKSIQLKIDVLPGFSSVYGSILSGSAFPAINSCFKLSLMFRKRSFTTVLS